MLKQQSHIVAPIPDELRTRALYTVEQLRERGKADKVAIDQLFELIVELTDAGLDFFFLEPLRRLNAGSMMMGMAKVGISSMLKGSKMVVHKVLKKLDDRSLDAILSFIAEIIHEPEPA
ncbi:MULTISPECIES: hypothetical protein [Marinobacter]|jgi:2-iminoacetate synthase ThiH|uniref:hypothetical protein n=2 Tax=Marinobacteraceae TaxID=2887365 RepID=UPI001107CA29|nr:MULTISPECIES: hypothetical protein [Marinobacter]MCK2149173.1 hypothetical protein [Marinobacter alexandrii]